MNHPINVSIKQQWQVHYLINIYIQMKLYYSILLMFCIESGDDKNIIFMCDILLYGLFYYHTHAYISHYSEDVQIKWDTPQWDELLLKIKAYTKTITKRKDKKKSTTSSIGPEKPKRQISQKQQKSYDKEESKKSSKICSVM